jgi:hypothetical protein
MTVEDDRDNSPLEEQIFGVFLLVPLFTVSFNILLLFHPSRSGLKTQPNLVSMYNYWVKRIGICKQRSHNAPTNPYSLIKLATLPLQKYLSGASDSEVTPKMKEKYATPVPSTTTFTKSDCSPTYSKMTELQQEYGFEYTAVVGSLIYLMNTYTRLSHSIRKVARFIQYPGRNHFNLLLHLLRHLQCHRLRGGIKFYSDILTIEIFLIDVATATSTRLATRCPAWRTSERGIVNSWFPLH